MKPTPHSLSWLLQMKKMKTHGLREERREDPVNS
jgi:hypothetical protein